MKKLIIPLLFLLFIGNAFALNVSMDFKLIKDDITEKTYLINLTNNEDQDIIIKPTAIIDNISTVVYKITKLDIYYKDIITVTEEEPKCYIINTESNETEPEVVCNETQTITRQKEIWVKLPTKLSFPTNNITIEDDEGHKFNVSLRAEAVSTETYTIPAHETKTFKVDFSINQTIPQIEGILAFGDNITQTFKHPIWSNDWRYYREIKIHNPNSYDLINFPVNITIDTEQLIQEGRMNQDCSDIRIIDSDGITPLPYWVQDRTCNTNETKIWINITIPANSDKSVFLYYGNANAISESNIKEVFKYGDDFNGDTLDTNMWRTILSTQHHASARVENGYLRLYSGCCVYSGDGWTSAIAELKNFHYDNNHPFVVETSFRFYRDANWERGSLIKMFSSDDDYVYMGEDWYTSTGSISRRFRIDGNTDQRALNYPLTRETFTDIKIELLNNYNTARYYIEDMLKDEITKSGTFEDIDKIHLVAQSFNDDEQILHVDFFFVREYADKEPTITVGNEQKTSYLSDADVITNWNYRIPISIVNLRNIQAKDYTVEIILDTSKLIQEGKLRPDCGDLRLATIDGKIINDYWIADGTCNTNETQFFVKIPEITATASQTNTLTRFYLLYGNPHSVYNGDINKVSIIGDDFNDEEFDTNKWYSWKDESGWSSSQYCYEIEHDGIYEFGLNTTTSTSCEAGFKSKILLPFSTQYILKEWTSIYNTYSNGYSVPFSLAGTQDYAPQSYINFFANKYSGTWQVRAVDNGNVVWDNIHTNTPFNDTWNILRLSLMPYTLSYSLTNLDVWSKDANSVNYHSFPTYWISKIKNYEDGYGRQYWLVMKVDYALAIKHHDDIYPVLPDSSIWDDYEEENNINVGMPPTRFTIYRINTPAPSEKRYEFAFIIDTQNYKSKGIIEKPEDINITPTPFKWTYIPLGDGQTLYIIQFNDDYENKFKQEINITIAKGMTTPNYVPSNSISSRPIYDNKIIKGIRLYNMPVEINTNQQDILSYKIYGAWKQEYLRYGDTAKDLVIAGRVWKDDGGTYIFVAGYNYSNTYYYQYQDSQAVSSGAYFDGDKVFFYGHIDNKPKIIYLDLYEYIWKTYYEREEQAYTEIKAMSITRDFLITAENIPSNKELIIRYLDSYNRTREYKNYTFSYSDCDNPEVKQVIIPDEQNIVGILTCNGTTSLFSIHADNLPLPTFTKQLNIHKADEIVDYQIVGDYIYILSRQQGDPDKYYITTLDRNNPQHSATYEIADTSNGKYIKMIISSINKTILIGSEVINGQRWLTAKEFAIMNVSKEFDMNTDSPHYSKSYYHGKLYYGSSQLITQLTDKILTDSMIASRPFTKDDAYTKIYPIAVGDNNLNFNFYYLNLYYPQQEPEPIEITSCQTLPSGTYKLNIQTATSNCIKINSINTFIKEGYIKGANANHLIEINNTKGIIINGTTFDGTSNDAIYIENSGVSIANSKFTGTFTNTIHANKMVVNSPIDPIFVELYKNEITSGTIKLENSVNGILTTYLNKFKQDQVSFDLAGTTQDFFYKTIIQAGEHAIQIFPDKQYLTPEYQSYGFTIPPFVGNIWYIDDNTGLSNRCEDKNKDYLCDYEDYSYEIDQANKDMGVVNLKLKIPVLTIHDIIENSAQAKIDIPNHQTIYEGWNLSLHIAGTDNDNNLAYLGYRITGDQTLEKEKSYEPAYSLDDILSVVVPAGTWTFDLYVKDFATYDKHYSETRDYSNPQDIYTISQTTWNKTENLTANQEIDKIKEIQPLDQANTNYYFDGILTNDGATTCKVNGQAYIVADNLCPYKWEVNQGTTPPLIKYTDDILGTGIPIKQNESDTLLIQRYIKKNITLTYYNPDGSQAPQGTFKNFTTQTICNDINVKTGEYISIYIDGTKYDITPEEQGVWTEFTLPDGRKAWVLKDDLCYDDGIMDFKVKLSENA